MANLTGKKYGGRKQGTPNKTTKEVKDVIVGFIKKNVDTNKLQKTFDKLDPEKQLYFLEKLLKYVITPAGLNFDHSEHLHIKISDPFAKIRDNHDIQDEGEAAPPVKENPKQINKKTDKKPTTPAPPEPEQISETTPARPQTRSTGFSINF